MRADVAEAFVCMQRLQHRLIVTPAFRASQLRVLRPASRLAPRVSPLGTGGNRFAGFLAQTVDIHEAEPDAAVWLDAAQPVRDLHVDRREADAVALRVFYQ